MSRISIASPQEVVPIDRGRLRDIVRTVLAGEEVADYEISLAFVDNATIHRLNKQLLDHDERRCGEEAPEQRLVGYDAARVAVGVDAGI